MHRKNIFQNETAKERQIRHLNKLLDETRHNYQIDTPLYFSDNYPLLFMFLFTLLKQ